MLQRCELAAFRHALLLLNRTLSGSAEFEALEGSISLALKGNGRDNISVDGRLTDDPGTGRNLQLDFGIDQTFLPSVLSALARVLA